VPPGSHLINLSLSKPALQAVRGEGVYLFDRDGRRYLDGCSGALVVNCGHGVPEIGRAMAAQAAELPFVYRNHFSTPVAEALAARYCGLTETPMGGAYFANSGSEAIETAVKLARMHHICAGDRGRHKIISRWQSYHGITLGALSWSGITARRADYQPYLQSTPHIPPAYCYRCWFGREPENCGLECARALESAILTEGRETIAAFLAEPVVGAALAAACPPPAYFGAVREICDRHGVLFIADEVMTGAGRTGGKFFASDHFPGRPDILAFGKGAGGGYYPLSGALVSRSVMQTLAAGPGAFAASQTSSAHPVGMAAGHAVLDCMQKNRLLERSAEMGDYLGRRLAELERHPSVGDVRGLGLMRGIELVSDKAARRPFAPEKNVHLRLYEAARAKGLIVLPSAGCDRGHGGDMALVGPPLVITRAQVDELAAILDEALTEVEAAIG
jgi:adenosylmethionine-8-amino-7-oxononanoate aminotransferase